MTKEMISEEEIQQPPVSSSKELVEFFQKICFDKDVLDDFNQFCMEANKKFKRFRAGFVVVENEVMISKIRGKVFGSGYIIQFSPPKNEEGSIKRLLRVKYGKIVEVCKIEVVDSLQLH